MPPRVPVGTLSTAFIIILLAAPALASPVDAWFVRTDPLKSNLASIPGEPPGAAPLTLRRQAYDIIGTIPGMEGVDGDFSAFADRARLSEAEPLEADAEAVRRLMRVYRSSEGSARDAAADAMVLLIGSARGAASVAMGDAGFTLGMLGHDLRKASSALSRAGKGYDGAMAALLRGDADRAARLLASSLESSLEALSLMGVSYAPDADHEGDGLIDIIELRIGSSPFLPDTDMDGMGDYYEVFSLIPFCMPADADTDGDGIPDGMEDTDEDGFTNLEEMAAGTNPLLKDDYPGIAFAFGASDPLALGSPGDGIRVLMDLSHGEWDGLRVDNMTLPIGIHDLLESYGFTVEENSHLALDSVDLSPYDVLLLVSPQTPFSPSETAAVEAYVRSGGSLLVSCDTQMTARNEAPNEIAAPFGVRFYREYYANESIISPDHPIMQGLSDMDLFQPFLLFDAAIDMYPSNAVILTDPPERPPLPNATEPDMESLDDAFTLMSERSWVPFPSMIAMEYGSGRAVFGPNNGLCQPWGKGIDSDAWYGRDVPNILLIRTVEWLATGKVTPPPPPPEGQDSDHDGLTDLQELAGFTTQSGAAVFTDPNAGDTDADGIWDAEELGTFNGAFWLTCSDPTRDDTDRDLADDLAELAYGTDPTAMDSDGDMLWDGEELYDLGTDPLSWDTDGDGSPDWEEIALGLDPLLYTPRIDPLTAAHEFALGLIAGEFAMADHGNMPFFSGLMASGAVSVIPGPGWLVGIAFDLRDFIAALCRGDWSGFAINTLALVPYVGDAADVAGTAARFVLKHPEMAGGIGIFMARVDWLSEAARLDAVRSAVGSKVIDDLAEKGFDTAKILKMSRGGIDLSKVNSELEPIYSEYPGLKAWMASMSIDEIDDSTVMLRGNGLAINLKKLCTSSEAYKLSARNRIIGAYTQTLAEQERLADGWTVLMKAKWISSEGYDLVVQKGDIVRVIEAKAGSNLYWEGFSDLVRIDEKTNVMWFNRYYFLDHIEAKQICKDAINDGKIEVEIFINNPEATKVIANLKASRGVPPEGKLFALYDIPTPEGIKKFMAEIILTGVLK